MNNIYLDQSIALNYRSNSQKIRVMTEAWTWWNIFCPSCGNTIEQFSNNQPVADFFCTYCKEEYELKSKKTQSLWLKIADWAYSTMINRLNANNNPNFFFLNYNIRDYKIFNFISIPKYYFTDKIIEKRNPLGQDAIRTGRVGCNILLSQIPNSWKIFYIKQWIFREKNDILADWKRTIFLKDVLLDKKWRLLDIMLCIEKLHKTKFSLNEIYLFERDLKLKYPNNNHIKDKIRQQLQILRDRWYLIFLDNWNYKLI